MFWALALCQSKLYKTIIILHFWCNKVNVILEEIPITILKCKPMHLSSSDIHNGNVKKAWEVEFD